MLTDDQIKAINDLYDLIESERQEGRLVLVTDSDGHKLGSIPIEKFIKQDIKGMLYDLNRLDEVLLALAKSGDDVKLVEFLPNELAMVTLLTYLYEENKQLKAKLSINQNYTGTHID